jgi:carbonic anhydrase
VRTLSRLFQNNKDWADRIRANDPEFFLKLSQQQSPEILWIGCSDSRVPANEIVGLLPGELFVHRNLANVVVHSDLNCLSVIQFAVEILKVKHIVVCGHYACSGVRAALRDDRVGLSDNWLIHVRDVCRQHQPVIDRISQEAERVNRLCELNVVSQVSHVAQTTIVRDAWARGQPLELHGWIYGLDNGLLNDMRVNVTSPAEAMTAFDDAVAALHAGSP